MQRREVLKLLAAGTAIPAFSPRMLAFFQQAKEQVGAAYKLRTLNPQQNTTVVAMVLIGLSNLIWMIALTAIVLIYKLAPAPTLRWASALSAAVVALGVLYTASA